MTKVVKKTAEDGAVTYEEVETSILDDVISAVTAPLAIFMAEDEPEFVSRKTQGFTALGGLGFGAYGGRRWGDNVPLLRNV